MQTQLRSFVSLVLIGFTCAGLKADETKSAPQLTVPPGFTIELVAGPPLVEHPTMGGFDQQGRLYICDGPGLNLKAKELLADLPNSIRCLEDTDGDGRFDRSKRFADKMTFPMGAVWHQGSVYTASPPHIWKLTDTDNDGVADERKVLVSEFGFTGNAADIHGCFLGPEGRIYWCDGRHGHMFVDENGKQLSKGLAARIFSCRPDGTDVEAFAGGGMDNPVELTFADRGEPIGTVAIFDIVDGRHDALVHWIYGGAYPRYEQPCVAEFKRTGDLMPPLSRFSGVAPAGVARYRGNQFGPEFRDNIFRVEFNTHTMVRTRVERDGATFRAQDEEFLKCSNPDFHPTDVIEDADGSLLVVDTGGWFRIGCPTSQTAKPEILGAIYRIRRTGAKPPVDPRGLTLAWDQAPHAELIGRLDDASAAVRDRAVAELSARGEQAVEPLSNYAMSESPVAARGLALWTLARIDTSSAREGLRDALADRDESVRQIAARSLGTLRDKKGVERLCQLLAADQPAPVRREAATALGRIGDSQAVPPLLDGLRVANDRFLEHALIYALIQLNDRQQTVVGLSDSNPQVRRGALIALDQMPAGGLTRELVCPLLDTDDGAMQKTTLEVIERHQGWAAETLGLLEKWLLESNPAPERVTMVRGALLAFCADAKTQAMVAGALASPSTPTAARLLLLEVIARSELRALPAAWREQVARQLTSTDSQVLRQAVATAGALDERGFDARLSELARDEARPKDLRLAALAILARHGLPLDEPSFDLLIAQLAEDVGPMDRLSAAAALGSAKLDPKQQTELARRLPACGPLELPALVSAFDHTDDPQIGRLLIAGLEESPGTENLTADRVTKLLSRFSGGPQAVEKLLKRMNANLDQQRARMKDLAASLDGGSVAHGKSIFFNKKAACSACHRVLGEGGLIGPDLSKVGQIRSRIDLLESVVFPSASFARGYESFSVLTDSGQVYTGILSRETADGVYLKTAQREEIRIERAKIEELAPSKLSVMPQGFDKLLSPEELRDVIAFLQSLK
jgi:putative membrane-bound dehydrogenase-like protein